MVGRELRGFADFAGKDDFDIVSANFVFSIVGGDTDEVLSHLLELCS